MKSRQKAIKKLFGHFEELNSNIENELGVNEFCSCDMKDIWYSNYNLKWKCWHCGESGKLDKTIDL